MNLGRHKNLMYVCSSSGQPVVTDQYSFATASWELKCNWREEMKRRPKTSWGREGERRLRNFQTFSWASSVGQLRLVPPNSQKRGRNWNSKSSEEQLFRCVAKCAQRRRALFNHFDYVGCFNCSAPCTLQKYTNKNTLFKNTFWKLHDAKIYFGNQNLKAENITHWLTDWQG